MPYFAVPRYVEDGIELVMDELLLARMAAEEVEVHHLGTRRSTVLVSNGVGVGVGHAGGRDKRCREQGRPACNPHSAKRAHRSPVLLLNPVGRDPLVDAGTSRASGATALLARLDFAAPEPDSCSRTWYQPGHSVCSSARATASILEITWPLASRQSRVGSGMAVRQATSGVPGMTPAMEKTGPWPAGRGAEIRRRAGEVTEEPFDLRHGPLFRPRLRNQQ